MLTEQTNGSMYYAPHSLFKVVESEERDSLNRIVSSGKKKYYICDCRCDENTTQKYVDDNGRVYIPKYKIVCERADIKEGDYVQCYNKDDSCCCGKVIGEGRVVDAPKCNYLDYMVLYV